MVHSLKTRENILSCKHKNQAALAIWQSEHVHFRAKKKARDKEGYYGMIKASTHQKYKNS